MKAILYSCLVASALFGITACETEEHRPVSQTTTTTTEETTVHHPAGAVSETHTVRTY